MTGGTCEPAPVRSIRFVRQLSPGIGLAMVMLLVHTSAFAQTAIDPTGRSGEPPGPLKEEFLRPSPPPSPVLPIVPLPPETGVPAQPGTVRVFVRDVHVIGNPVSGGSGTMGSTGLGGGEGR